MKKRNKNLTFRNLGALLVIIATAGLGTALLHYSLAAAPTINGEAMTSETPVSDWDRPTLTNPTTITISDSNRTLHLNSGQDYYITCPPGQTDLSAKITISGGRNVVFENCDEYVTDPSGDWAADFENQTGTLWVHDVHFGGAHLTGGFQMQEPGAVVVLRDILFDEIYGSYTTNHAEFVQTWAGPDKLLIDGLTGPTTYQGLFLLPNQWYTGPEPTIFDFRNINIDDSQGGYALWLSDTTPFPVNVQNVYVVPNSAADKTWRGWWLYGFGGNYPEAATPCTGTWCAAQAGTPPGGNYVSATNYGATGPDEGASPTPLASEELADTVTSTSAQPSTAKSTSPSTSSSSATGSKSGQTTTQKGSSTSSASAGSSTSSSPPTSVNPLQSVSLTAAGQDVSLYIHTKDGKPIKGAIVVLDDQTAQSNAQGMVDFIRLAPGNYTVSVKVGSQTLKSSIKVISSSQPQSFKFTAAEQKTGLGGGSVVIGVICLLAALSAFFIEFLHPFRKHLQPEAVAADQPNQPLSPPTPTNFPEAGSVIQPDNSSHKQE